MRLKVIYLDDEPDLCEIFSEEFGSESVVIQTFTRAHEAIEAANNSSPDIVFLDYRLPEMDGDLVAEAMPAGIPRYLVTGEWNVETRCKFDGVFGKPWDRERIHALLAEHLKARKHASG